MVADLGKERHGPHVSVRIQKQLRFDSDDRTRLWKLMDAAATEFDQE
jgi:hypothetical protein